MISGKRFNFLSLLALLFLLTTQSSAGATVSLLEIFHPVEQQLAIRYREEKNLGILNHSLTGSGVLRFSPPDTLVREVDGMPNMSYRIEGSQISITKNNEIVRQLDLQAYPELAAFAVTLRALLKADIETLDQQYIIMLTGSLANWHLLLSPRYESLSRIIEQISIEGSHSQIRIIDTYEKTGDHSHMILVPDE